MADLSVDGWLKLYRQHRNAAQTLCDAKQPNTAWGHAGFAVECCLKAAIMKRERLNRFPPQDEHPELWTHNLEALLQRLGITPSALTGHTVAPSLKMVLDWRRAHGYSPEAMPIKRARDMCKAAFGADGVLEWLAETFHLDL